ncbi:hypothetical protein D3C79_795430 [compost metagenome]
MHRLAQQGLLQTPLTCSPGLLQHRQHPARQHAEHRLPVPTLAHHRRTVSGHRQPSQVIDQLPVNQRRIASQHHHPFMARHFEPGNHPRQRPREVCLGIAHHLVGIRPVGHLVTVAGNHQVIAQRSHHTMNMCNQRLALPVDQALVATTHALPAAAGEDQQGARRQ